MKWVYTSQRKEYSNALVEIGKMRTDIVVLDADLLRPPGHQSSQRRSRKGSSMSG